MTEQLLAVLDMSEDEQWKWLYDNHRELGSYLYIIDKHKHLADLAFRLRDEVTHKTIGMEYCFTKALDIVEGHCNTTDYDAPLWWIFEAKPIHWIIAALIAKGGA